MQSNLISLLQPSLFFRVSLTYVVAVLGSAPGPKQRRLPSVVHAAAAAAFARAEPGQRADLPGVLLD